MSNLEFKWITPSDTFSSSAIGGIGLKLVCKTADGYWVTLHVARDFRFYNDFEQFARHETEDLLDRPARVQLLLTTQNNDEEPLCIFYNNKIQLDLPNGVEHLEYSDFYWTGRLGFSPDSPNLASEYSRLDITEEPAITVTLPPTPFDVGLLPDKLRNTLEALYNTSRIPLTKTSRILLTSLKGKQWRSTLVIISPKLDDKLSYRALKEWWGRIQDE